MTAVHSLLDHLSRVIPGAHASTWGGGGRSNDGPTISTRTPEGNYGRCPVCRVFVCIEPSVPFGDAPCPCCGHLISSINPQWPFGRDDRPPPRRKRRKRAGTPSAPTLAYRLGLAVARGSRALRRAVRSVGRRTPAPPTRTAAGGVWDYWLDG